MRSQNMPLGYKDYFELKSTEKKQIYKMFSAHPYLLKRRMQIGKGVLAILCTRKDRS